jgi:hypothetical protein
MEKHTYNGNTKTTQITTDENGVVVSKQEEIVVDWLSKELMNVEPNTFGWDKLIEQAEEMHKQEMEQHAINFYLFVENDEVTDQKVEFIENLYKDYLKQFYNETFGGDTK